MTNLGSRAWARTGAWRASVTVFLGALLLVLAAGPADAHRLGESYLYLQVYEESVTGRFEIGLTDLNPALGIEGTPDEITRDNIDQHAPFLKNYYREHVSITHEGKPISIDFGQHLMLGGHGGYVLLPFTMGGLEGVPERLTFDYTVLFEEEPSHRGFLLVEHNWATGTFANEGQISMVFSPDEPSQTFDFTTSGWWTGFVAVVKLGMEHIWEGVDHILFLLALLLPAVLRREDGRWQPIEQLKPALMNVVKIVTGFTVAHSITLSLAALGWINLPGKLVEVVIAASIAIAAADLLFPIFRGRVFWVVVIFGLFHGFGFAGALSEMGILREKIGWTLFGFNLGVEIGQVAIVLVLVPILFLVRRWVLYRKVAVPLAAVLMILVSTAWVVERAFEVDLPIRELLPAPIAKLIP